MKYQYTHNIFKLANLNDELEEYNLRHNIIWRIVGVVHYYMSSGDVCVILERKIEEGWK